MQRKSMLSLKREALGACRRRKHDMKPFENGVRSAISYCRKCSGWIQVIPNPYANEIDIGGPAVAVHCERSGKTRKDSMSNKKKKMPKYRVSFSYGNAGIIADFPSKDATTAKKKVLREYKGAIIRGIRKMGKEGL